jgi:hypothetical protein
MIAHPDDLVQGRDYEIKYRGIDDRVRRCTMTFQRLECGYGALFLSGFYAGHTTGKVIRWKSVVSIEEVTHA